MDDEDRDEYLWDRSGEPDSEVERLEQVLGTLAFVPRASVVPPRGVEPPTTTLAPRTLGRRGHVLKVALLSAAATMLLIGGVQRLRGSEREAEVRELAVPAVSGPAAAGSGSVPGLSEGARAEREVAEREAAVERPEIAAPGDEPAASAEPATPSTPRRAKSAATVPARTPNESEPGEPLPAPTKPAVAPAPRERDDRSELDDILTGEPRVVSAPPRPQRPSGQDIKDAVALVKAKALACGPRHGAAPGTRVAMTLSVEGKTGRVLEVRTDDEHHGTPLGRCIVEAFTEIRFPSFETQQFGFQYTLRTP